jgi:hypothetical protein
MIYMVRSILQRVVIFSGIFILAACSSSPIPLPPKTVAIPVTRIANTNTAIVIPATGSPDGTLDDSPTAFIPATDSPTVIAANNPASISQGGTADTQPVSAPPDQPNSPPTAGQLPFDAFVDKLKNGNADQIVGVYVENVLALRVVQQPDNAANFVSTREGDATQFLLAYSFSGNIGLLAHNFLSGKLFFNLKEGDIVRIVYGNGDVHEYAVERIESYQALKPDSLTSDFLDIASGETITATNLFYRVYGGDQHVTFQTCITQDNNSQWGRLFVIANPL